MILTYDTINAERLVRGQRAFSLSEYEQYRGRYSRMAQPGTDVRSFLLGIVLRPEAPDYSQAS